jgi:hypothetical protein
MHRGIKRVSRLEHSEDDRHELAHPCADDRHLGVARLSRAPGNGANRRGVAHGYDCREEQRLSELRTSHLQVAV